MAITHFGNKMLRGTKVDRVSDSLGSSADGSNNGIIVTGGKIARPSGASWDFTNILYSGKNYDVSSKENQPATCTFKTDGTKFYVVGEQNATIYEFTCSTAWDVSTASYTTSKTLQKTTNYGGNTPQNCGIAFKSDGLKCFVCERNDETIHEYALSSAWDISTLNTTHTDGFSVSSQTSNPRGVWVNSDGTKFYVPSTMNEGSSNDTVFQYTCSTGWDLTTASYASKSKDYSSKIANGVDFAFNNDGTKCYVLNLNDDGVFQFTVDTAYDVTTIDLATSEFLNTNAQDSTPLGFYIEPTQKKIFVVGLGNDKVSQYSDEYYGAYSYDASSDSVDIPADINLGVTGTSSFTITGWFNLDSVGANREIFRKQVSNGQAKVEIYYTHGNQTIICDLGGTTTKILSKVETGKWYHLTIRRVSGDKDYFYINGQLSQTNSTQSDVTGASGSIWYIGNRKEKNEAMIGKLDDIGFSSRALEESEIQSLTNTTVTQGYKGGLGGDTSPYSGGGGGGAGGAGANGSSGVAGAGGVGIENPITGSEVGESNGGKYWLGGGGGGFGNTSSGAGGKGGGSGNNSGDNGTANTGGGAGARNGNSGAGGSGVVLVSYQTGQITDGSSDGSLETGSNIPSGYAIRKFVLTGSSTQNFNFVISSGSGNVQYVIVGGGGGGGTDSYSSARASGGGGGGGFVTGTKSMSAGTYSVTVGRGGADATNGSNNDGGDGDNSVFDGTTAYGGGGGATHYSSESSGFWGRAGCKGTGGGGNNSAITRGLAVYNTDTGALVSSLSNKAGLKAHYTMDSATLEALKNTPDYTFNFSSDTDWDRVGSGTSNTVYIDTSAGHIRHNTTTNTSAMKKVYYDLTDYTSGSAVNDSKWTMRFKWVITNQNAPSSWLMALSHNTNDPDATSFNGIGIQLNDQGGSYGYHICTCDGSTKTFSSNVTTPSNSQTLYVELARTSATKAKLTMWSDSYGGTEVGTSQELTIPSGVTALKYLQSGSGQGGNSSRTMNATLDDLEIFDDSIQLDGCKNDASSTSDLDAMTNLPENTIFFQTDDTPKYYWKQYDNTWSIDAHSAEVIRHTATGDGLFCGGAGSLTNNTSLATNYVWATNSANLPNNLGYSAGGGYKSSFMACGGYISSGNFFDSSTIWDGSAWASAVALDTQRRDTTAYGGNTSSAIIALGRNNSGTEVDSSSKWNGTSWSSAGAIGSGRVGEHVGGDGGDVTMLISGGSSSRGTYADKWDGTSWSSTTNIPQATISHNHAGKSSESAHIAGGSHAYAYDWDGTSWTQTTTITQGSDSTPRYVSGGGTKDSHWVMCGLDGGTSMNNCTLWNGTSWTAKGNMTEAQYGGLGDGTIR